MHLLFPGRHHLLTDFQFKYLYKIIHNNLKDEVDVNGIKLNLNDKITDIIFAVTSSNHSNTRRNPLPFHLRAMSIQLFSHDLNLPCFIYGIDDAGNMKDFAGYTLKKINHESNYKLDLNPDNTIVLCSTAVLDMYEKLGFKILPAELIDKKALKYSTELPWEIVERIAASKDYWLKDYEIVKKMHHSSMQIWQEYNLGETVKILFEDKIIGEDGDITSTRDYNSYVRQMDEIAGLKYNDTKSYIKPGRIGDIGCAVGSWIKLACEDERFRESDFYGIEVARHLYDICLQRYHNGEFENPCVFFSQKNAVTGLVFRKNSMNTIHTSSLTHEIESYGSRDDLLKFIKNRFEELTLGGVWINRDVVGPENKDELIYMELNNTDGRNDDYQADFENQIDLKEYLKGLSTFARFLRFAADFRKSEGLIYEIVNIDNKKLIKLKMKDACEFMEKKDYIDNWKSEMHETFCFWNFNEWIKIMKDNGFKVDESSRAYSNEWIVKNRFIGKVNLYKFADGKLNNIDYPVTNMILIGEK